MCLAPIRSGSQNTVPSPNAACASRLADFDRPVQFGGGVHRPHAPTAAPGRRLNKDGKLGDRPGIEFA